MPDLCTSFGSTIMLPIFVWVMYVLACWYFWCHYPSVKWMIAVHITTQMCICVFIATLVHRGLAPLTHLFGTLLLATAAWLDYIRLFRVFYAVGGWVSWPKRHTSPTMLTLNGATQLAVTCFLAGLLIAGIKFQDSPMFIMPGVCFTFAWYTGWPTTTCGKKSDGRKKQ